MTAGFRLFIAALSLVGTLQAQTDVTSPKEFLGFSIGDDYMLANYVQLTAYFKKLDAESDRMSLVSIGKTEEGRNQYMAIISSPENLKSLEHYKAISRKLALGEAVSEDDARRLSSEGKAVVWIDGGLHASEVLGAQQLIETVYQLVSRDDPETTRIRSDCIILCAHANPDGMDLVSDWYMRRKDPKERSMAGLPRLYQKYVGHDNNRDFYASNMSESVNINRVLYRVWFPRIVYNHHQTAPAGTIIFAPPFRGPFNFHVDPLAQVATDMVGLAMHTRFISEGKPGAVMRNAASYQTWWNGGLRTTCYFHNMIGILTEAFGNPTPSQVSYQAQKLVPSTDIPFPIEPQEWHFKQSIDYEVTANYAVLDFASRYREALLMDSYRMARNAVEKGKKDTWTYYPSRITPRGEFSALKDSALRDAKAYIIPLDQSDFPTAVKFVNMLVKTGVTVYRSIGEITANGKKFPAGSLVVFTGQPFRAHVLDMFEPQDYPNDFQYPGGPPIPPYDNAGYTPAFTMGVQFERVLDNVSGPFERISDALPLPMKTLHAKTGEIIAVDCQSNNAFLTAARLSTSGVKLYRASNGEVEGVRPGAFLFEVEGGSSSDHTFVAPFGIEAKVLSWKPADGTPLLKLARIGLLDRYGGSIPSGWTRWILERFDFPFEVVYPPEIDRGNLKERFDVLILVDGMTFGSAGGVGVREPPPVSIDDSSLSESVLQFSQGTQQDRLRDDPTIPEEWRDRLGNLTQATSLPKVKEFLEAGGTVVAIGSASDIGRQLGLPIASALTETVNGQERPLPREKFYCPGSVLRIKVDNSLPIAFGMPDFADVIFDNSPAFKLLDGADAAGIKKIAWYDSDKPLRSGWCWGQAYLKDAVAALEAPVGKGKLYLFGPEILFRGQTHGSFKFLFNALFL